MMNKQDYYQFIGRRLRRSIYRNDGTLLLNEGTELSALLIKRLINLNVSIISYQDAFEEQKEKLLTPLEQEVLLDNTVGEIREIFYKVKHDENALHDLEVKVIPVVKQISNNYDLSTLLNGLKSKDDYTYRHNIGVSVLASLLARWLNLTEAEINLISIGGLLHDIGKVHIPDKILNKKGRLTDEEYEIIKKHTVYGYEILNKNALYPQEIALMALEHHERNDGNGYPHGKLADDIHPYSKIIAICDVFHAMSSDRVYRKGLPIYEILMQMRNDSFGMLDPKMTNIFILKMMEMSIGNTVMLNNEQVGEVVFIHKDDPINPLVKIDEEIIDLRFSNLKIATFIEEPSFT